MIQSPLPIPPISRLIGEKAAVFGNRRLKESYIIKKNLIWDLEMGGGIGPGGGERRGGRGAHS